MSPWVFFALFVAFATGLVAWVVWDHYAGIARARARRGGRRGGTFVAADQGHRQSQTAEVDRSGRGDRKTMRREEIEPQVISIVAAIRSVSRERVTRNTSFVGDLDCDILDLVELVLALEERFDIEIPDAQTAEVVTVGDAVRLIYEQMSASGGGDPQGHADCASEDWFGQAFEAEVERQLQVLRRQVKQAAHTHGSPHPDGSDVVEEIDRGGGLKPGPGRRPDSRPPRGRRRPGPRVRVTHCWQCKNDLDSRSDATCESCSGIRCACGACLCNSRRKR